MLGALPLATGIAISILSSSVLLLLPCGLIGGAIFGPFLAGMFDSILRGLRDDPNNWWTNYKKSWRQNLTCSLLPGALLGMLVGVLAFMAYLFWAAQAAPTPGTIAVYLFSILLLIIFNILYWPQLVLFQQSAIYRVRNILLFTSKYFLRVLWTAVLHLLYFAILIFFAPWTLILVPLLGLWYIIFLTQFLLYDRLDRELHIEEQFEAAAHAAEEETEG